MKPSVLTWELRRTLLPGITTTGNVTAGWTARGPGPAPRASVSHWEVTSPRWSPRQAGALSLVQINPDTDTRLLKPHYSGAICCLSLCFYGMIYKILYIYI